MQEWQVRVIEEKIQLELKIEKLKIFVGSPLFETVVAEEAERTRLHTQLTVMETYRSILAERIENF